MIQFIDAQDAIDSLLLRVALSGPEGSGKTRTALEIATVIAERAGGLPAVIDSEHKKSALYARFFHFRMAALPDHDPRTYVKAIKAAESAGYPVIVIDSLTHAWKWLLAYVERTGATNRGGTFSAWKPATPIQEELIETILASKAHIICTMRAKTEYVQERDERGKTVIRKIGLKAVQRDDVGYEFDLIGSLDSTHTLTVTKSRFPSLDGREIVKPGRQFALALMDALGQVGSTPSGEADVAPSPPPVLLHGVEEREQASSFSCIAAGCLTTWEAGDSFRGKNGPISGRDLHRLGLEEACGPLCYQHLIAWMTGQAVEVKAAS